MCVCECVLPHEFYSNFSTRHSNSKKHNDRLCWPIVYHSHYNAGKHSLSKLQYIFVGDIYINIMTACCSHIMRYAHCHNFYERQSRFTGRKGNSIQSSSMLLMCVHFSEKGRERERQKNWAGNTTKNDCNGVEHVQPVTLIMLSFEESSKATCPIRSISDKRHSS